MKLVDHLSREGKTPAAFAGEIGTTVMAVYRYLSGKRIPTPEVMARIVAVTGGQVTANDFYSPHPGPLPQGEGEQVA